MRRALVYYRVSTPDQTTEHQKHRCVELCQARGWADPIVIEETGKRFVRRAGWAEAMALCRAGKVHTVVIWALDRIGGAWAIADAVRELDRLGVTVVSVEEAWLEQSDPLLRQLLVWVFGWVAGVEIKRLAARTAAAQETARRKGKTLGRPRTLVGDRLELAIAERRAGKSWGEIAAVLKARFAKTYPRGSIQTSVVRMLGADPKPIDGTETPPGEATP